MAHQNIFHNPLRVGAQAEQIGIYTHTFQIDPNHISF
jgi:hypothetical protein